MLSTGALLLRYVLATFHAAQASLSRHADCTTFAREAWIQTYNQSGLIRFVPHVQG
jgi:hypothetical protein